MFPQTFSEQTGLILTPVKSSAVAWGDMDNDGDLDIVLSGYSFAAGSYFYTSKIYRNNSNVFSDTMSAGLKSVDQGSVALGDYDKNGFLDILLTGQTYSGDISKIYRNNGNSTFSEQVNISLQGVRYSTAIWGDIDNDGDLDIFLAGASNTGKISKIYCNNSDGTFTEKLDSHIIPLSYCSAAFGDFNNDQLPDILVTGKSGLSNSEIIVTKIYKNTGDGSFSELTGANLPSVWGGQGVWGDYNNDGFLDILLAGSTDLNHNASITRIYKNNGNETFSEQTGISLTGVHYSSMAWGDYDNDGLLDILITGATNRFNSIMISKIYHNNGNDTFSEQPGINFPGVAYSSVACGDYNKDGKLDILLTGRTSSSEVTKLYLNTTTTANTAPAAPTGLAGSTNGTTLRLAWKPVKTDNTPFKGLTYNVRLGKISGGGDIIPPLSSGTGFRRIAAMGNAGNDTSILTRDIFAGSYYWSVQAIDHSFIGSQFSVQQNLIIDTVQASMLSGGIVNNNSIMVRWKRGNGRKCIVFCRIGSGGFSRPAHNKTYVGDNTYSHGDQIGSTGWFCVYNGIADSLLLKGLLYGITYSLHIIDYVGKTGSERYFREIRADNIGSFSSGFFTEQTDILLPGVENSYSAWADYNNDGYLDILVSGRSLDAGTNLTRLFRNNGDGSFTPLPDATFPGVFRGIALWGDYNNDGFVDILLSGNLKYTGSSFDGTKIFKNNGNGTFTEQNSISLLTGSDPSAGWGDYDNDGDLDLFISTGSVTKLYRNNGTTFEEQTSISLTGVTYGSSVWGDFDKDGFLDIFLVGSISTSPGYVNKIYHNNGNNTFTEQFVNQFPFSIFSLECGDYDNDGDLDVALNASVSDANAGLLYRNNGNGSFENTGFQFTDACGEPAWGDYNNDGYPDLLFSGGYSGYISKLFKNNGPPDYTFTEQTGTFSIGASGGSAKWGDYNNDGNIDILITGRNSSSTYSKLYRNSINIKTGSYPANKKPSAPASTSSTLMPDQVKLNWALVTNDETPATTMSYNFRYKKTGEAKWKAAPQANDNGRLLLPAIGNLNLNTSYTFHNLPEGKYYWSVQAVDQGFNGGSWSPVDSFEVRNLQTFFSFDEVCMGYPTHFNDQSVATAGFATWKWDFSDGSASSVQSPVHTYSTSGTYYVKLVITDNGGKKDSLVQSVIVRPKPLTDFSAPAICQGTSSTITNTTDNNGLTVSSWYWDFGDGSGSNVQNPGAHGYLVPGTYNAVLAAVADNGCTDTIKKTVNIGTIPTAAITSSGSPTFCSGDSIVLTNTLVSSYNYTWQIGGTDITGANQNTYTAKHTGSYTVRVINPTGNCTALSSPVNVIVNEKPAGPVISYSGSTEFCQGDSVILSVTNSPGYTYQWKQNGGAVGSNSNQFIVKNSGTYNLTVSNSNNCSAVSVNSVDVKVNPVPAVSSVSLIGKAKFCAGENATLSVTPTTGNKYKWKDQSGYISGATSNSFMVTGSGAYQLEISNSSGCMVRTEAVNVEVGEKPLKPVIDQGNYTKGKCLGETPIKLSVEDVIEGYSYQWYKNGAPVSNLSFIEDFLEQGQYYVEASINECKSNSDSLNIYFENAPDKPVIYAKGPTVWYLTSSITNAAAYRWWYNGNLIPGSDSYMYIANQKLGKYNVSISEDKVCFTMSDAITIPTGVTGIEDADPFEDIKIYPNPTPGMFTVEMDNNIFGKLDIRIFTNEGKQILNIIFEKTTEHFSTQIDLSGQSKGVYLLNMMLNKYMANRKVVVE